MNIVILFKSFDNIHPLNLLHIKIDLGIISKGSKALSSTISSIVDNYRNFITTSYILITYSNNVITIALLQYVL